MNLLDELTLDDLDEEQRDLAELVGIEAYKRLINTYAGSFLYISKPDTLTVKVRNRKIIEEFNGYNYYSLARKYNLTERYIRKIVAHKVDEIRSQPIDNQISFWD